MAEAALRAARALTLIDAAERGRVALVAAMLADGTYDVNQQSDVSRHGVDQAWRGVTALIVACANSHEVINKTQTQPLPLLARRTARHSRAEKKRRGRAFEKPQAAAVL